MNIENIHLHTKNEEVKKIGGLVQMNASCCVTHPEGNNSQELAALGEADGVVAALQFGVVL